MLGALILILEIVGGILAVTQGIPWLLGKRPKSHGKSLFAYVNYEKKALVEEREYEFDWGWVFFLKKIFLQNVSENALCKLSYKPMAGPKKPLPQDCFMIKKVNNKNQIKLLKNDLFNEREIERIYVLAKTPLSIAEYDENIKVRHNPNGIEIVNKNDVEIRNYILELPPSVTLDKVSRYLNIISGLIVPDESSDKIKIRIKKLEAKQGDEPSIMIVPLYE